MSGKKKSFAQELADLFNPAPTKEHDPDELDIGDAAKLASDDEYGVARSAPSKRAPEKAMLLRGDITLEDAAYRGKKTSRAAIFGGAEDAEDGDMNSDSEELDGSDDSDEEEEEENDGERRAAAGRVGPSGRRAATAPAARVSAAVKGSKAVSAKRGMALENGTADSSEGEEEGGDSPSGSLSDLDMEPGEGEEEGEEEARANGGAELNHATGGKGRAMLAEQHKRAGGRSGGAGGESGGGDELEMLEAEYEAVQEEDDKQLEALRKKGERDRVKGTAIRNQQVLYERVLEQRILLQKCLQASNGLPRPKTFAALIVAKPDVLEGYSKLASAARTTLSQLLDLQYTLMARNTAITLGSPGAPSADAPERANGLKRGRLDGDVGEYDSEPDAEDGAGAADGAESLWRQITCYHEALAPFRDVSLDSWHRRTVLSSGSGALRNSGLRALNQSISNQVKALMRDPAKFIKRTRLVVSACPRVLCEPPRARSAAAAAVLDPLGDDGTDDGASAWGDDVAAGAASQLLEEAGEEEHDPETYDDSEFYQQLLKEFLDKGLAEGAAAAPKSNKKRKLTDRKASKGRKLRYHVQEKLVAFMAPVDFTPPPFAANLFTNLFGHAGK